MGKTTIELVSLEMRYFKGFRDKKIEFNSGVTSIIGDNGTGKSTIADAFTWLFFGKDTQDNSDTNFSIKTIDQTTGEVIPRVDHSVEAIFLINGDQTSTKRVLKEKWTKKKGATKPVYTGNKTDYYWNEVPLTKRDYEAKISQFISEEVFKMITDPYKFNSLHWEKQRAMLEKLEGGISDADIAEGNDDFENLMGKLVNKNFDEYKSQMKHTLKRLKQDKEGIPARIDEQLRNKPESIDFAEIDSQIKEVEKKRDKICDQIDDKNKAAEALHKQYEKLRSDKAKLVDENIEIRREVKQKVQDLIDSKVNPKTELINKSEKVAEDIIDYKGLAEKLNDQLASDRAELENVVSKKENLSKKWDSVNSKELIFDDDKFVCPSCKRPLEAEDEEAEKEKLKTDFIKNKKSELEAINKEGIALKTQQEGLEKSIDTIKERLKKGRTALEAKRNELSELNKELAKIDNNPTEAIDKEKEVEKILKENDEYQENLKELQDIQNSLDNQKTVDIEELKEKRSELTDKVLELKTKLDDKAKIESIDTRVKELEQEEKENAQLIANAEKELDTIQRFEVARMTKTEKSINAKFKHVQFKMFKEQVDGTQEPYCVCLYDGVPFPDVNTAGQIKAGLDIINTLCDFYEVNASIFIDGAESITEIPETDSQQIRLIVKKGVKPFEIQ